MTAVTFVGNATPANGTSFHVLDQFTINALSSAASTDGYRTFGVTGNGVNATYFGVAPNGSSLLIYRVSLQGGGMSLDDRGVHTAVPYDQSNVTPTGPLADALHTLTRDIFSDNDSFDISGAVSLVWGDFADVPLGATVALGSDTFYIHNVTLPAGVSSIAVHGDAVNAPAGSSFIAGNDLIDASAVASTVPLTIYGDFQTSAGNGIYGADTILGGAGADLIFGDTSDSASVGGNDLILGGDGGDTIFGGGGNDELFGDAGNDTLNGGDGDDTLHGGLDPDVLNGGIGFDYASYEETFTGITANLSNPAANTNAAAGDTYSSIEGLIGSSLGDTLTGDGNGNVIFGMQSNDTIDGQGGDDLLIGGPGGDTLTGGLGFDYASYQDATAGVTANLANSAVNTGDAAGDTYFVEGLIGSNFADTLIGDSAGNVLQGGDGNDTLDGAGGNDLLLGGNGDDILIGGSGGDNLTGNAGFDYASYQTSGAGVTANLANSAANTGDAVGDIYFVEGLIGSNSPDTLIGNSADNILIGGPGGDTLNGGGGFDYASYSTASSGVTANLANSAANTGDASGDIYFVEGLIGSGSPDTLIGDSADNILIGGAGADMLNGGGGFDYASYSTASSGVTANLANSAANTGDAAGDIYFVEGLIGSNFADTLIGDSFGNVLQGLDGNDRLDGSTGNDLLLGGAGADTFVFRGGYGSDRVGDFDTAQDKIELQNNLAVSFNDVMLHAAQVGADVQFTFGSEVLTLANMQLANLSATNFLFVS
jgi:serralysin